MIRSHSKRLLSPYMGLVQIVETERARALSLEGTDWSIPFRTDTGNSGQRDRAGPPPKKHYVRVVSISGSEIQQFKLPHHLDDGVVEQQVLVLADYLKDAILPLPPADELRILAA